MTHGPNIKQLAAVVHDVVTAHTFDDWADLAEAVKTRCARLRLPYDSGTVTQAVTLVARTRAVLRPRRSVAPVTRRPDVPPLSRAEAAVLWARIRQQAMARGGAVS